jgi:hypothetical protein
MAVMAGRDVSPTERRFTVIIRGAGSRRYWHMKLLLRQDHAGEPYLEVALAGEPGRDPTRLFELGHCIATDGAAALGVDLKPYLDRHAAGDWGQLSAADQRANNRAVKQRTRIFSAYDVPLGDGETARIWIITESDRSVTTALLPEEY